MAHFMSNENNDDNDNCENTIQSRVGKETKRGKATITSRTSLKILEFEFSWGNKAIFNSKLVITSIIFKSCFISVFLKIYISREHDEKKPVEVKIPHQVVNSSVDRGQTVNTQACS